MKAYHAFGLERDGKGIYGDVDPKLGMSCKFHRNMLVYELCVHKIAYYYYILL